MTTKIEAKLDTARHYAVCIRLLMAEVASERVADCKAADAKDVHRALSEGTARLDEAMMWAGSMAND